MRQFVQLEGYGVRLRPVRMDDAAFIVWLRNLKSAKGRIGDSALDVKDQQAWLRDCFEREGDYYFIIETLGGIPVGTQGVYDIKGDQGEVGRWVVRPDVQAAIPSYVVILNFAFNGLRLRELRATTVATNRTVVSLNKKFGFEQFQVEPAERVICGEPVDMVHCVLKAEIWARTRERLLPMAQLSERLISEWEQNQLVSHHEPARAEGAGGQGVPPRSGYPAGLSRGVPAGLL